MKNKIRSLLYAALLSGVASAYAAPALLGDVADDWFSGSAGSGYTLSTYSATENLGGPDDGFLRVFGTADDPLRGVRAAMEFSMAGLNPGDTVNSATFQITTDPLGTKRAGGHFQFWGYAGDGQVTSADATMTTRLLATVDTGQPNYALDVTAFIQDMVNGNATFAGILITVQEEGPGTFFGNDFNSADYIDVPVIVVDATAANTVPEPASLALVGLALTAAGLRRRRA